MDVLGRLFAGDHLYAGVPGPTDDYWYQPVGGLMTPAGVRVDEEGAQKLSAWYRGRDILATVLAMLPFPIYQRLPNDGGSEPAPDHPLYDLLHDQTNDVDDAFQWKRAQMFDLIDHGHGYDWIVPGGRGFVHHLVPIEPTLVTPKRLVTTLPNGAVIPGREIFDVRDAKTGRTSTFTQDEIFHLRGAGGKGILEHARVSLGTALATETYAGTVFGRGTLNGGYLENPGQLDPDASKRMAESFITSAGDWRLPKVLEQGSTFKESKMSPEDFQMLLSRKFSVDDICRWLGVPRQMLENSDPSFGNAEQFWQSFLTIGMGGWLSLFEFAVNSQLILAPKKYFAQFTRQAIARGDLAVRWTAHVAAVNAGIVTVDEVRGVEDLNKRGGKADELREPQNITGKPAVADPTAPAPTKKPPVPTDTSKARAIVTESAARVLRKETQFAQRTAVKFAADADGYAVAVVAFYADHHVLVMATMCVTEPTAKGYCAIQQDELLAGLAGTDDWTPDYLASLALDGTVPDPMPGLLKAALEKPAPAIAVPVTIAKGAIEVHPAIINQHAAPISVPVTIAEGAIHLETHIAAPAKATVVQKTVTRDAKGQITGVTEAHSPTMTATLADASEPSYGIGDRVRALVDHEPGMVGMVGEIAESHAGDPPYYAVLFDGETDPHKWLTEAEIEPEGKKD
jgi:HK97 family phage portal protein